MSRWTESLITDIRHACWSAIHEGMTAKDFKYIAAQCWAEVLAEKAKFDAEEFAK